MSSSAQTPATACSCSTTKAGETCNCQATHECKCAPGECTCTNCPAHKPAEAVCTCKPECKCAPGTCECGTCPNSSKNKPATCNCKPDCKCAPGACTCPGCPKSQKA
ncbi:hypothetical protein JCM24511_01730 [Saitozyma sp. JCM 24511]|nr:hypothetical protein JCM24511_01730 [Saitozyma sp. JCM 24511]